jgi:hypothetical protein
LRNYFELMAKHDLNHIEHLKRALTGQPRPSFVRKDRIRVRRGDS